MKRRKTRETRRNVGNEREREIAVERKKDK